MIMPKSSSLNRRQWLGSVGAALAGLLVARRLPAAARAAGEERPVESHPDNGRVATPRDAVEQERRYIHGFEVYPAP